MRRAPLLLKLLIVLVVAAVAAPICDIARAEAAGLRELLGGDGVLRLAGRGLDRAAFARLYAPRDFAPIWAAAEREAGLLEALAGASAHGLDPAVFAVPEARGEERELLLTDAFLRYASALARGRVAAADIESDWALPSPDFDAATVLDRAANGDVAAVLDTLPPAEAGYARLQTALARYTAIAAAGGWPRVPDGAKLIRGDKGAAVALRHRLVLEGFLAAETPGRDFDGAVEMAVKQFQAQHGIAVDGHVGPATFDALNISAPARVDQIRTNLERWREQPRDWPATRIEVNTPAAWLTVIENGESVFGMRAIVGAPDHPTPVLRARMNAVLFNPPWNVPAAIVKNEILPHLKHDPRYLERNHYVWLGQPRASAMQQLPGPDNALGRIKFELPNAYDVYLHDTPSHPLFGRAIRTLSHGCVRLEEPRQLALYVLAGKPGWLSAEDVDSAVAGGTRRVSLARSLPVHLLYWTAFVDNDGTMEFRDDIYDRDLRLLAAMAAQDAEERLEPAASPVAPVAPAPLAPTAAVATPVAE
jgi:L,D-transpeptidase YcbB